MPVERSAGAPSAQVTTARPVAAAPAPRSTAAPTRAPAKPALAPLAGVEVTHELKAPLRRLAIDRPPHVAALGARSAWIHDAKGWREEPLPAAVSSASGLELDVFYGRDYRLRVVGHHGPPDAPAPVYLRWLPGGFRAAPDELGRLGASAKGGLLALLGTADPELVCRRGDHCLVKRLSGWGRASAPADLRRLAIADEVGWAIAGQQLFELQRDWSAVGAPGSWQHGDALFVIGRTAWVVESARSLLHVHEGGAWRTEAAPLAAPRAIFSTQRGVLWLAADAGLARFADGVWQQVREISGALSAVTGREDDVVWVAGEQGVFRVALASKHAPPAMGPVPRNR